MADPQSNEFLKKLVSDRLKRIDLLLKEKKVEDAAEEIREIRSLDPTNPYARAYEERISELKKSMPAPEPVAAPPPPAPPRPPVSIGLPAPVEEPEAELEPEPEPERSMAPDPGPPVAEPREEPRVGTLPVQPPRRGQSRAFILMVDDNGELLEQCTEMLEDHEFAVAPFTTADDALTFLLENQPDLIICDVHLETSSFGGFTFYEKIRNLNHLRDVPFLFLSGLKDSRLVFAGKELGADDYLTKPIEPEELLAVVRGKLKRYRQLKRK